MELLNRRTVLKSAAAAGAAGAAGAVTGFLPGAAHAAAASAELFASDEAGLLVDRVVVLGEKSAVLIDAPFTAGNARLLADRIAGTGRTLESILITHVHPDHILGLPVLLDRLPDAKAYAQNDIQAILALITPVHIPSLETLIATEVAYIDTHLWMEEVAITGTEGWRSSVETLHGIGAKTVIPGDRKSGSPNDATVFDASLAYLDHWEAARAASANAEEFPAKPMDGTEDLGFGFAIDRGVAAAFPA